MLVPRRVVNQTKKTPRDHTWNSEKLNLPFSKPSCPSYPIWCFSKQRKATLNLGSATINGQGGRGFPNDVGPRNNTKPHERVAQKGSLHILSSFRVFFAYNLYPFFWAPMGTGKPIYPTISHEILSQNVGKCSIYGASGLNWILIWLDI